ncbi:hypothetical protein DPEC_G00011780 [Dallia pectoralis]|uniref:Uncharacterized protein n=1 Tax=Dallia pectoralis TaxID=75939 RepID=A0ACC2HMF4_DALPE|nr:hypothetical protein DPEC_G00011780 [Dallia pectoralis]
MSAHHFKLDKMKPLFLLGKSLAVSPSTESCAQIQSIQSLDQSIHHAVSRRPFKHLISRAREGYFMTVKHNEEPA